MVVDASPEIVSIVHKKPGGKVVRTRQKALDWAKGSFVADTMAQAAPSAQATPAPQLPDSTQGRDRVALPYIKTEVKGKMMFDDGVGMHAPKRFLFICLMSSQIRTKWATMTIQTQIWTSDDGKAGDDAPDVESESEALSSYREALGDPCALLKGAVLASHRATALLIGVVWRAEL